MMLSEHSAVESADNIIISLLFDINFLINHFNIIDNFGSFSLFPDPGTTQFQFGTPWLQFGTGWFQLGIGDFQSSKSGITMLLMASFIST